MLSFNLNYDNIYFCVWISYFRGVSNATLSIGAKVHPDNISDRSMGSAATGKLCPGGQGDDRNRYVISPLFIDISSAHRAQASFLRMLSFSLVNNEVIETESKLSPSWNPKIICEPHPQFTEPLSSTTTPFETVQVGSLSGKIELSLTLKNNLALPGAKEWNKDRKNRPIQQEDEYRLHLELNRCLKRDTVVPGADPELFDSQTTRTVSSRAPSPVGPVVRHFFSAQGPSQLSPDAFLRSRSMFDRACPHDHLRKAEIRVELGPVRSELDISIVDRLNSLLQPQKLATTEMMASHLYTSYNKHISLESSRRSQISQLVVLKMNPTKVHSILERVTAEDDEGAEDHSLEEEEEEGASHSLKDVCDFGKPEPSPFSSRRVMYENEETSGSEDENLHFYSPASDLGFRSRKKKKPKVHSKTYQSLFSVILSVSHGLVALQINAKEFLVAVGVRGATLQQRVVPPNLGWYDQVKQAAPCCYKPHIS
ncbi:hypothetical protein XENOCAPTIV_022355 [Xenoophorus captivus]|uniref:Uncharacterized protein n=1 Tax=Xenoophorus captivus TaxID=1517983 RepID=A0ABV0RLF6_9TELE